MLAEMNDRGSFAGHETFPLRYTWLRKAVQQVEDHPDVFNRDDAMVRFGVGRNMIKAIRHWALAVGVIEPDPESKLRVPPLQPTLLGRQLLTDSGWDPFFEDPATYWLVHWQLASTPKLTTWYWVFNHVPQPEFSKQDIQRWLWSVIQEKGWRRTSEASLKRDIDCFIRTYVAARPTRKTPIEDTLDCPLVELGLLREYGGKGNYLLQRGDQPSLPDEIVAHAMVDFIEAAGDRIGTLPLDTLAFAPGSPGRVFCLTEDALLRRLERLSEASGEALAFDETAGLRQVLIRRRPEKNEMLGRYYDRQSTILCAAVGGGR